MATTKKRKAITTKEMFRKPKVNTEETQEILKNTIEEEVMINPESVIAGVQPLEKSSANDSPNIDSPCNCTCTDKNIELDEIKDLLEDLKNLYKDLLAETDLLKIELKLTQADLQNHIVLYNKHVQALHMR
jgi:hypothetical protein